MSDFLVTIVVDQLSELVQTLLVTPGRFARGGGKFGILTI